MKHHHEAEDLSGREVNVLFYQSDSQGSAPPEATLVSDQTHSRVQPLPETALTKSLHSSTTNRSKPYFLISHSSVQPLPEVGLTF
jgi:hypothetical protein